MLFFFFNDTATTEIYTLSLHDALPIFAATFAVVLLCSFFTNPIGIVDSLRSFKGYLTRAGAAGAHENPWRSEEHTSELQSPCNIVCRLLLEKNTKSITCVVATAIIMCS